MYRLLYSQGKGPQKLLDRRLKGPRDSLDAKAKREIY